MKKLSLLLTLLSTAAFAQATPHFDPARLSHHVEILASDAYEGRGPATAAEPKVIDYIVSQFKAAGLQPGGDLKGGTRLWTQDVPLLRASIVGTPTLGITSNGTAMPLTQGEQIAVRAALTGEKHVSLKDVPLVFVGYGTSAPERKWDDFKGVDVRGKILVGLINDPDFETGQGDFGGKAMTYYGRWTYKYEEAARRGAAGVLIVHETAPASYGWATVKNSNANVQFDIVRAEPKKAHTPFETWIQRDLAVKLFADSGLDFEAAKKAAQARDFTPMPLEATLSADYAVDAGTIVSHNIVGRLAGAQHPDETIVYSAHWDHLGVGQPDAKGDRIYNGAVDNADGISVLIETARAFAAAPRPDRSVLFLAVTAEEKGLLGSEYYAANPLYPLATTVGMLNTDALSTAGPAHDFTISGNAKLGLLDDLIAEGAKQGRTFTPDPQSEAGHFYRSDHFPLAKRGVPAISIGSGEDLVEGGKAAGKADSEAYVRDKYHQPADEWTPAWNAKGQAVDAELMFALGQRLANSREWPNWSADSEFRGARDATAAARKP
ncbi:M28 family metallopeptidase [Sphingomonas crusticola]|uniref:M28 family metallopeptidase n=1 Tax=Sphingomonas crusticola TaxID=1697973 RepID=UPI000E24A9CD|nr:M28 family metallopeptidase [Sphingomonas crusticola]